MSITTWTGTTWIRKKWTGKKCTGLLALLISISLLSACGGGSPAEPQWLKDDAPYTSKLTVLDDGTQLVAGTDMYLRDSDGNLVGSVDLPRGGYQIALSEGDHFVLFGLAGQDVWRVQLSAAGIIEADEVIYSGSALSTFLTLKQFGDIAVIHWEDGGRFTWYSQNQLSGGQYPVDVSDTIYTLTPNQHFWYIDRTTVELVEIDLSTLSELGRSTLDNGFLQAYRLYVNAGFVVGTVGTDLHEGADLLVQNRATQELTQVQSFGGYGTFKLNTLGQDAAGNIYYYYFAALAHSGFHTGTRVRAISNTAVEAWDYKVMSGEPSTTYMKSRMLNDGFQFICIGESTSLVSLGLQRKTTTHYLQLSADKSVVEAFFLQPHVVNLPPGNVGYPQLVELGYLGGHFATTPTGDVYIYGRTGYSTTTPTKNFAARY